MSPSKSNPAYICRSNKLHFSTDMVYSQAEKSWLNAGGLVLYSYEYILGDLTIFSDGRKTNKRYQLMLNNHSQTFIAKFRSIKEALLYIAQHS